MHIESRTRLSLFVFIYTVQLGVKLGLALFLLFEKEVELSKKIRITQSYFFISVKSNSKIVREDIIDIVFYDCAHLFLVKIVTLVMSFFYGAVGDCWLQSLESGCKFHLSTE